MVTTIVTQKSHLVFIMNCYIDGLSAVAKTNEKVRSNSKTKMP